MRALRTARQSQPSPGRPRGRLAAAVLLSTALLLGSVAVAQAAPKDSGGKEERTEARQAFRACLLEEGIPSGKEWPDRSDPAFQEALEKCKGLLPEKAGKGERHEERHAARKAFKECLVAEGINPEERKAQRDGPAFKEALEKCKGLLPAKGEEAKERHEKRAGERAAFRECLVTEGVDLRKGKPDRADPTFQEAFEKCKELRPEKPAGKHPEKAEGK